MWGRQSWRRAGLPTGFSFFGQLTKDPISRLESRLAAKTGGPTLLEIVWDGTTSSHFQPNGAHQLQCIAARHDSGAQAVVETNFATLQVILKMDVDRASAERVCDLR